MSSKFDDEDWFFRSVREYDELFMYDLHRPADCLTWFNNNRICISCCHTNKRFEVQQLNVPAKLLNPVEAELSKDRDFKVINGGFHSRKIKQIIPHKKSRLLLVSDAHSNSLTSLSLPDEHDDDMVREIKRYENTTPTSDPACVALTLSGDGEVNTVAFGSHGNNVCLIDWSTGQIKHSSKECTWTERLCGLSWLEPDVLLAGCRTTGQLVTIDTRTRSQWSSMLPANKSSTWSMAHSARNSHVYLVNIEGDVIIYTQRDQHKCLSLDVIGQGQDQTQGHGLTLKCCPTQGDIFSVSGMDGNVYIYSSTTPSGDRGGDPVTPLFTHQGHMTGVSGSNVKVTDHIWHPIIPQLMISSANDGSLHAWKYSIR